MREILSLALLGIVPGLVMAMLIISWITRILLVVSLGLFFYFGVSYHEKHHRGDRYDSKLSSEEMEKARDRWVTEMISKKESG
jgi:uncharacterized membrane protein